MLLKSIARILVKHAGNAAGFGVAGDAILDITDAVWNAWNKEAPDQQQKQAEVQQLAEQSAVETRQVAQALAQEVAADQPEPVRQAVASYLTQVPSMVRRSLKRPADPTGRTLPPGLLMSKPEDLLEFLPARPARFKPGDTPLPGVDWELEELLGVGGFGEVWRARNAMFDGVPPVALKFCLHPEAAKQLRHEAAVLNQVMRQGNKHPGIVQLQHTYLTADPPCLEYEYIAGGDLTGLIHDRHRAPGGCSPLAMTELVAQLAEIVGFAHRLTPPIVHRDLKTANVLVSQAPGGALQLKVMDFGIGGVAASQALKDAEMRPTNYVTAMATGTCTPLYASPQQQAGKRPDPRDDVYSLGVIWFQALTGNLSAGRPGGAAWRRRLVEQGLPAPLVDLLESCFEDDPDGRPRDAAELAEQLKALLPRAAASGMTASVAPPAAVSPVVALPLQPGAVGAARPADQPSDEQADADHPIKDWPRDKFLALLFETRQGKGDGQAEAALAQRLMEWFDANGVRATVMRRKTMASLFPMIEQGKGYWGIVVRTDGKAEIPMKHLASRPPFTSEELRREYLRRLNAIPGVQLLDDAIGRLPTVPLATFTTDAAYAKLVEALGWFYGVVRGEAGGGE